MKDFHYDLLTRKKDKHKHKHKHKAKAKASSFQLKMNPLSEIKVLNEKIIRIGTQGW